MTSDEGAGRVGAVRTHESDALDAVELDIALAGQQESALLRIARCTPTKLIQHHAIVECCPRPHKRVLRRLDLAGVQSSATAVTPDVRKLRTIPAIASAGVYAADSQREGTTPPGSC